MSTLDALVDTITVDILQAMRDQLADPAHWCQGTAARLADGTEVTSNQLEDFINAPSVCLTTAFEEASMAYPDSPAYVRVSQILNHHIPKGRGYKNMIDYNDDPATIHADIIGLLNISIAYAKTHPCGS